MLWMTSVAQVLQRATETNVPLCVSKPVTAVYYKPGLLPLGGFPFNCVDLKIVKKSWLHCQVTLQDVEHLSSFFWLGFFFLCLFFGCFF